MTLTPIGDGRLGVLRVGMSVDRLWAACPGVVQIAGVDEEGAPRTLYGLPTNDRDTVFAVVDAGHGQVLVRWFSVPFAGPRTVDGVGVGSSFREIKAKYKTLRADDNEGTVYVWPVPDHGLSLALSVKLDALDSGWRQTPSVIPDTAHVTKLVVRAPIHEP